MKMIKPSAQIVFEDSNPLRKIESIGRTCYKSHSDFTEESSEKFFDALVSHSHYAMLEHVNVVFEFPPNRFLQSYFAPVWSNPFLRITSNSSNFRILVSGNVRAINESGINYLLNALYKYNPKLVYNRNYFTAPICAKVVSLTDCAGLEQEEIDNHYYTSIKFTCDRGVSHELVRHRIASFAQESTRYCNYSKEKFGSEITYIQPADYENWIPAKRIHFDHALQDAERSYFNLLTDGCSPQEARAVLPNATKTEIVMTANEKEWKHFFNLRVLGTTGTPHPDMLRVAKIAREDYFLYKQGIMLSIQN